MPDRHLKKKQPFYAARVAVAALGLSYNQEDLIWDIKSPELKPMLKPEDYEQLRGLGVVETELTVPKFKLKNNRFVPEAEKTETVILWERKGDPGKPHYLIFHGQNGHWGDAYSSGKNATNTQEERDARLNLLKMIAQRDEGFTAVTLRGYGKRNDSRPSQAAHDCDIAATVDHLCSAGIPFENLKVAGVSLGTYYATKAMKELADRGHFEPELILENPFTDMKTVGTSRANENPAVKMLKVKMKENIIEPVLRHRMSLLDNLAAIGKLGAASHMQTPVRLKIFTSEGDEVVHARNSDRLEECAVENGLTVERRYFPGAKHCDIPDSAVLMDEGLHERPRDWGTSWPEKVPLPQPALWQEKSKRSSLARPDLSPGFAMGK